MSEIPVTVRFSLVEGEVVRGVENIVNSFKRLREETVAVRENLTSIVQSFGILSSTASQTAPEVKEAVKIPPVDTSGISKASEGITELDKVSQQLRGSMEQLGRTLPKIETGQREEEMAVRASAETMTSTFPLLEEMKEHKEEVAIMAQRLGMSEKELTMAIGSSLEGLSKYNFMLKLIKESLDEVAIYSTLSADAQQGLQKMFGLTDAQLRELEIRLRTQRDSLAQISTMNKAFVASLGAGGIAFRAFARELFWTSLGIMFFSMSLSRMIRTSGRVKRDAYSLARAEMDLEEAQRNLNEVILEYGPRSEEARQATIRLKEAEMALDERREMMRENIEALTLSYMMLVFGTFPTVLRGVTNVIDLFMRLNAVTAINTNTLLSNATASAVYGASKTVEAEATNQATKAQITNTLSQHQLMLAYLRQIPVIGSAIAGLQIFTTHTWLATFAAYALTAALTLGIGALISWAVSTYLTGNQMREMEEQARRLKEELAGSGLEEAFGKVTSSESHFLEETKVLRKELAGSGLVEDLFKVSKSATRTVESINELSRSLEDIPIRSHSPLEIRTAGGWTELPEFELPIGLAPGNRVVNIYIEKPVVSKEQDIYALAREIRRAEERGLRARIGGRM